MYHIMCNVKVENKKKIIKKKMDKSYPVDIYFFFKDFEWLLTKLEYLYQ